MMKKMLFLVFSFVLLITVTGCGKAESNTNNNYSNNQKQEQKQEESGNNNQQNNSNENTYVDDDEIIEYDDEDNKPIVENKIDIEEVINCDGCVYAYFSGEGDKAKKLGDTITADEYTTDINEIRTMGNNQRHNFFGLVLSGNTIIKAYACILKENKIYCIQGSTDGTYFSNNIGILNQIFTTEQCKYISNGHTYTCTDGNYNGDTKTSGYTSLHYETSCTIYGADSNTGKLICH